MIPNIKTRKVRRFIDVPQVFKRVTSCVGTSMPAALRTVVVTPVAGAVVVVVTNLVVRRAGRSPALKPVGTMLGVGDQRVTVVGNLKVDVVLPVHGAEHRFLIPVGVPLPLVAQSGLLSTRRCLMRRIA